MQYYKECMIYYEQNKANGEITNEVWPTESPRHLQPGRIPWKSIWFKIVGIGKEVCYGGQGGREERKPWRML